MKRTWADYLARPAAPVATRRVVLLGASNLTRGLGTVLSAATQSWGGPLEVMAALGHGRSYGRFSRFFAMERPGILHSGLWAELARRPTLPTAALVTDIGNDLLYEEPVEQIVLWVRQCLDRLAAMEARTVVTLLPVENLATLSRARFQVLRTFFFPNSRITLAEVSARALELNQRLQLLADERGFTLMSHRSEWYGFDPIHIRLRQRSRAWREILSGWSAGDEAPLGLGTSLARTLYLRSRTPQQCRLLGIEQQRAQPAARLSDGTTVSLY